MSENEEWAGGQPPTLDAEIGPFYDTAGVQTVLGGMSEQVVAARRTAHTILALQTADRCWVYPTFQFTGGDVDPALAPAIQGLRDAPAWSAALWFVTSNPDLSDATPLVWARGGRSADVLVTSARRTAHEWGNEEERLHEEAVAVAADDADWAEAAQVLRDMEALRAVTEGPESPDETSPT